MAVDQDIRMAGPGFLPDQFGIKADPVSVAVGQKDAASHKLEDHIPGGVRLIIVVSRHIVEGNVCGLFAEILVTFPVPCMDDGVDLSGILQGVQKAPVIVVGIADDHDPHKAPSS